MMSPPTPAPSPTPKERWQYTELGDVGDYDGEHDDVDMGEPMGLDVGQIPGMIGGRSKGKRRDTLGELLH